MVREGKKKKMTEGVLMVSYLGVNLSLSKNVTRDLVKNFS